MLLLVNDDGIDAPGLRSLYQALRQRMSDGVLVAAPNIQQSGQGHAITLNRGLSVTPVHQGGFFGFAVDGTPTDCCKIGLHVLCHTRPKLVVSGINDGPNVGRSLLYSGTVAVALEAAIEGHAAVAISRDHGADDDHQAAADYAAELVASVAGRRELRGAVLNLNLPAVPRHEWQDLRCVPHGRSGFDERYQPRRGADGSLTWKLHGTWQEVTSSDQDDASLLTAGHPVLSVIRPNFNAPADEIPPWLLRRLTDQDRTLREQ